jgi:hypothetical protein
MFSVQRILAVVAASGVLVFAGTADATLITGSVTSTTAGTDYWPGPQASDGFADSSHQWVTQSTYDDGGSGAYFARFPAPVLTIDLGADTTINGFALWNYSLTGNRITSASMRFATASEGIGHFGSSIIYNPTFTLDASGDYNTINRSDYSFNTNVTARYIQMTVLSNNDQPDLGGDRVGFAEIQFNSVPEPSIFLMLAGGALTGLFCYAWRKRR